MTLPRRVMQVEWEHFRTLYACIDVLEDRILLLEQRLNRIERRRGHK